MRYRPARHRNGHQLTNDQRRNCWPLDLTDVWLVIKANRCVGQYQHRRAEWAVDQPPPAGRTFG